MLAQAWSCFREYTYHDQNLNVALCIIAIIMPARDRRYHAGSGVISLSWQGRAGQVRAGQVACCGAVMQYSEM